MSLDVKQDTVKKPVTKAGLTIGFIILFVVIGFVIWGIVAGVNAISHAMVSHPQTAVANTQQTPKTVPPPAPQPQTAPAPTPKHTIIYQFSLMSGSMNSTDLQNVGISWHDPTTGDNKLPSDIAGAVQQINAGSYSVTYHVDSVDLSKLHNGVSNYSDPDAKIACTILVDGSSISNEIAPESGFADCSGDGTDSQSGN